MLQLWIYFFLCWGSEQQQRQLFKQKEFSSLKKALHTYTAHTFNTLTTESVNWVINQVSQIRPDESSFVLFVPLCFC